MTKTELEAAIAEHNRIIKMITEEIRFEPNHQTCWVYQDLAEAINYSFFEAYADGLSDFPETKALIIGVE